jgi:hypothetical protein
MQIINIVQSKLVTALVVIRDAIVFGFFCVMLVAFMYGFLSGYFGV